MILLAALAIASACLPVQADKDQITAGDLAQAIPAWSVVAKDTSVALAPMPGVIRYLRAGDLRRLGIRFGVAVEDQGDVCFERPLAPIPRERMLSVMQSRVPEARIEILESSHAPAPEGDLDFPLTGLRSGYWYGFVTYGQRHRFFVWARVNVKVAVKRVVASADLKVGQPIDPMNLRMETREEHPSKQPASAVSTDSLAGRIPRRTIVAGSVVPLEWLDAARLVEKGDTVKVEVIRGSAHLEAEGIAESSGALGDIITIQNPDSKRRFQARIEAHGRVSVKGGL
jgi:flagella basal body P-ring formation protein FlgA